MTTGPTTCDVGEPAGGLVTPAPIDQSKPLLVYDGDCGFCRHWASRWRARTGERINYAPARQAADQLPGIPPNEFAAAVQLILPDGTVYRGAQAVFEALGHVPGRRWLRRAYRRVPGFALITETAYRFVSRHRGAAFGISRLVWGKQANPPAYTLSRLLFLRLLGATYLIAFLSLAGQLRGLVGSHGILPAGQFLAAARQQLGGSGYWHVPTLAWLNADDWFLTTLALGGAIVAILPILGIAAGPAFLLLWLLYLSLVTVGQEFLSFQWDILLLEAGFLAVFFSPWRLAPHRSRMQPPSGAIRWLLVWLLFRLMVASGVVKLKSGDVAWRNLTALNYHYETQPLPTWIGWWTHQLPEWFQKFSTFSMFAIELGAPLLILTPRRVRHVGAWLLIGFQLLIIATGNYTFFNLLTIALCVLLFDDGALRRILPRRIIPPAAGVRRVPANRLRQTLTIGLSVFVLTVTGLQFYRQLARPGPFPALGNKILSWVSPLRTFNAYGLFAVMTRPRREIIVEGSNDGQTWLPYEFKWKPGDVNRPPGFVAPHQPRLDWQMWFAALSNPRNHPWFFRFLERLLEGNPAVLDLLEKNPFPDAPPRHVRGVFYEYRFTTPAERQSTSRWWERTELGLYVPPISLRSQ